MSRRSFAVWVAVVASFVLALCLRLWNIRWGLPFNYDPWEQRTLDLALGMARRQSLDPGWLEWPTGSVYLALAPVRMLSWLAGVPLYGVGPPAASPGMLVEGQDAHLLGARLVVALLGAGVAAVAARAAWRLSRRAMAAWVAGSLAACLPALVAASQRIGPLGPATFAVALALAAALALARREASLEQALWAGGAVGLAAGFHYAAALVGVPVLVAALRRPGWWRKASGLLVAAAAAGAVFLLTTPYAALHPAAVAHAWLAAGPVATSQAGLGQLLADPGAIGPLPLGLAGAGFLFLAAPRVRGELGGAWLVLGSFAVALVGAASAGLPGEVLAALSGPAVAILAGATVAAVAVALQRGWLAAGVGVAILAVLAPVALAGGRVAYERGDARTESMAFDWFRREVPAGARVLREWRGPQLSSSRYQVMAVEDVAALGIERLEALGADYIVLGEASLRAASGADAAGSVARRLLAESHAVAWFCGETVGVAGPDLVVLAQSARARALHRAPATFGRCPSGS